MKTLESIGLIVTPGMTTPSRPGKKPRPVWTVSGAVDGYEALFRTLEGKKWRGSWSFWSDPTEDLLAHADERMTVAESVEYKAERKLAKADRYDGYAENATERATAAYARVKQVSDRIPMGQPILIGHHSERGARADQRRIERGMDKFCAEHKKSESITDAAARLRRDAEAPKTLSYIGNRIKECETEVRRVKANLEGKHYVRGPAGQYSLTDADIVQQNARLLAATQKLEYWQGELAKLGESRGGLPGPDTIKNGYLIRCWAGTKEVVKVNAKSVTIRDWWSEQQRARGETFTRTIKYTEVRSFFSPTEQQLKDFNYVPAQDHEEAETQALEAEGMTRSDAQGVVEANRMKAGLSAVSYALR